MSLLKEAKQGLQEVVNKEAKLGVKEYLMALISMHRTRLNLEDALVEQKY